MLANKHSIQPIDPLATPETKALLINLSKLSGNKILFGHQNTTLYGISGGKWYGDPDRSDVKSACGSYPAVYGWDMQTIFGKEAARRDLMATRIKEAFARGGVNTISWHMSNPVTGKNFYDTTPSLSTLLPGGEHHEQYKRWMEFLAVFARSLTGADGRQIPIIFRPFHEHTGSWFWWGRDHCTTSEFIDLWRFTVEHLRDDLGVHHFLYAYSPAKKPEERGGYFERYPGDAYVDVLGMDHYSPTATDALDTLRLIVREAQQRGKIAALTECGIHEGLSGVQTDTYFTRDLLAPIQNDPVARRIVYLLVWQNQGVNGKYWVPYEGAGEKCLRDFKKFAADPVVVMQNNIPELYGVAGRC